MRPLSPDFGKFVVVSGAGADGGSLRATRVAGTVTTGQRRGRGMDVGRLVVNWAEAGTRVLVGQTALPQGSTAVSRWVRRWRKAGSRPRQVLEKVARW